MGGVPGCLFPRGYTQDPPDSLEVAVHLDRTGQDPPDSLEVAVHLDRITYNHEKNIIIYLKYS